jgi:hypothetical protein
MCIGHAKILIDSMQKNQLVRAAIGLTVPANRFDQPVEWSLPIELAFSFGILNSTGFNW